MPRYSSYSKKWSYDIYWFKIAQILDKICLNFEQILFHGQFFLGIHLIDVYKHQLALHESITLKIYYKQFEILRKRHASSQYYICIDNIGNFVHHNKNIVCFIDYNPIVGTKYLFYKIFLQHVYFRNEEDLWMPNNKHQ